jgi:hypothetical protein
MKAVELKLNPLMVWFTHFNYGASNGLSAWNSQADIQMKHADLDN